MVESTYGMSWFLLMLSFTSCYFTTEYVNQLLSEVLVIANQHSPETITDIEDITIPPLSM